MTSIKKDVLKVNVSPNTITDFKDFTVSSTMQSKSHYELSHPTFIDRLNYYVLGMETKKHEESLNDFFEEIKKEKENIIFVEIVGKAKAYSRDSPDIERLVSLYTTSSSDNPLSITTIPDMVHAKRKIKDTFYSKNPNFLELINIFQDNLPNLGYWLRLNYKERGQTGIKDLTLSPHSLLRVKEVSWLGNRYDNTVIVNQTALLGFSAKSKEVEDKIFAEDYLIKLKVLKQIQGN